MDDNLLKVIPASEPGSPIHNRLVDHASGKRFILAKMGDYGLEPAMTLDGF